MTATTTTAGWCLAGFAADAATTWFGITTVPGMYEANPVPASLMGTYGLGTAIVLMTMVKVVAILSFLWAVSFLRSHIRFDRSDRIVFVGIVMLLFIGWLPALNNFYLISTHL